MGKQMVGTGKREESWSMTAKTTQTFGAYLRHLRLQARLTQAELALAVGYSPGHLCMLENDQRTPDPATIPALFIPVLGLTEDRQASELLQHLAENGPISTPKTNGQKAKGRPLPTAQPLGLASSDLDSHQQGIGRLEAIPPTPPYAIARPQPLARLQQWLARERWVAICGLAGMGKTTLAAQFAQQQAHIRPVSWITICPGLNDGPEQLLRQLAYFVVTHSKTPATVLAFFRDPSPTHPAGNLQQLLGLLVAGLDDLDAPLLVLDDAHHLHNQPATLQLIQRLQTLVTTCQWLLTTRQELALPGLLHLNLEGMEEREVEELVGKLRGDWETERLRDSSTEATDQSLHLPISQSLALTHQLFRQTAGSPMLIRLAVSHIEASQAMVSEQVGRPLSTYLIETTLQTLDESARLLLDFLAIWRTTVDLDSMGQSDILREALPHYNHGQAVSALAHRRLIEPAQETRPHPLLRAPVLQALQSEPLRQRTIRHAAAKWASHQGDLVEAAYHYACAGDLHNACDLITNQDASLHQAGRSLSAAGVVEEIIVLARQRLRSGTKDVAESSESIQQRLRQMLVLRGDLLAGTTRADDALASYYEAMTLAKHTLEQAALAEKMAMSLYRRGQMSEAVALCEQGSAMLGTNFTSSGIQQRILLETTKLKALLALVRFAEARQLCEDSLILVKPVALLIPSLADTVRAYSHMALGYMARFEGQPALASEYLRKSIKHARAARLLDAEIDGLALLGCAQRDLGEFAAAEMTGQQALDLAYANGNEYSVAQCLHFLSLVSYNQHELRQAIERSRRAQQIKELIGDFEGLVACRLVETLILSSSNQLEQATACVTRALTDSQLLENGWLRSLAFYAAAMVHTFLGNLAAATTYLKQALAEKASNLDLPYLASMLTFWGYLYVAQGRFTDALRLVAEPSPPGGGVEVEMMRGIIQGMALLGQGDKVTCRRVVTLLATRASQHGYRLYLAEAEQLLRLIDNPPPAQDIVRSVCCRTV